MMAFLAQVVFVGRNDDFEGWVQILVFVIIAVGYVLSGILKAKSKKTEQQQGGQPRPVGAASRRQVRAVPQPQAILQKLAEAAKVSRLQATEPQVQPQIAIPTPQIETPIPELPEIKPAIEGLPDFGEISRVEFTRREEKAEVQYPATLWLNISDPEEIRRAILYYEILGKPMSMREPGEQVIGL